MVSSGGVSYWDAQFDDARLAIALMRTAVRLGAVAINYVEADELETNGGLVGAIVARDVQTQERFELRAKVVFNATGVWADDLRRRAHDFATTLTAISRGSHITLPASFLPGSTGMMIPRTVDGRVLFAIPWHGHLMLGTTDVAANGATWEPEASDAEVEFILDTARGYLQAPPSAGRRAGDLRRIAAAVFAARSESNQDDLARARHRDRAPEPDHRDRRQVDDLSQDGARCARSSRESGPARCATVRDRGNEA